MKCGETLKEWLGSKDANFVDIDLRTTGLENMCPDEPNCNPEDKYRTTDGSCNNLKNPLFGKSFTPLQRILPNDYADGMMLPRVNSKKKELPSSRFVSTKTHFTNINPNPDFNSLMVTFGQFLDHDIDHVPVRSKTLS